MRPVSYTHLDVYKRQDVAGVIVEGTKSGLPNPNIALYRKLISGKIPILFINTYYPELEVPHAVSYTHLLPDLVVIEGPKAGGHLGFSYEQLEHMEELNYDEEIREIIGHVKDCAKQKETDVPVVVAGGIYTREDAEDAVALGADGVQMATRFVTTYECDAPDSFKQAYLSASKEDIALVKSPVGMPGRAIKSSFYEKTLQGPIPHGRCHLCVSTCKPDTTPYCITDALVNAARAVSYTHLPCTHSQFSAVRLRFPD